MAIAEQDWQAAVALLSAAPQVALACHIDPDGDALGSLLAFHRFLASRGVSVTSSWGASVSSSSEGSLVVPSQYSFLPGLDVLVPPGSFPQAPPVLVVFDCASRDRLGTLAPVADRAGTVVVVDHHARGSAFGDVRLLDGEVAATAVLVEELIRRMGGQLDREMAVCLYVGLVTDTARFQYASTTPEVMRLGAELIGHGIDHAAINQQVWDTHSFGYMKVLGRALERARMVPEAGLAWTSVSQDDLDDLGISLAETEGLIDVLRGVEAAECTMVAKEQADGRWKVSLRTRGRIDVGQVSQALGGGGHAFAAGFTASGTLDEVVERVVEVLISQEPTVRAAG